MVVVKQTMTVSTAWLNDMKDEQASSNFSHVSFGRLRTVVSLAFIFGPAIGGILLYFNMHSPKLDFNQLN